MPLFAAGERIGLVRRDNAEALRRFPDVFRVADDRVELVARVMPARSAALSIRWSTRSSSKSRSRRRATRPLSVPRWGDPPIFRLDRGAVPFFGDRAYGVHLNGYRRDARRTPPLGRPSGAQQEFAPNKLDNIVAGGIGNGHGLAETLVKEADEEAMIPAGPDRARGAGRGGVVPDGDRSSASATTCCLSTISKCRPSSCRRTATASFSIFC